MPSNGVASPEAFGLPGDDALRELLASSRHVPAPSAPHGAIPRYFVDDARAAEPRALAGGAHPPFDVNAIRRDFPILQERVNGKPLIWFDNAATTHKPQAVIDRLAYFYAHENSNIHRAAHALAGRATDAYEHARDTVRRFIGAASPDEIVFVRGTTEAINLIAKTWGVLNVGGGDEIVVSHIEHHANIVPWQQLAAQTGARKAFTQRRSVEYPTPYFWPSDSQLPSPSRYFLTICCLNDWSYFVMKNLQGLE